MKNIVVDKIRQYDLQRKHTVNLENQFYNRYYDLVRTPDFDDTTRDLKPKHGLKTLGSSKNKVCRFCGNTNKKDFKKVAHVFPESIGNKALSSNYECDKCNSFFGRTIENDYAKYFSLYHSIMQIHGKKGIPSCGFSISCPKKTVNCSKYCVTIRFSKAVPEIRCCREVSSQYINFKGKSVRLSKPIGSCSPIAVYKTIVKMAISVMPIEDLPLFTDTIKWLMDPVHKPFNPKKKLLVKYQMIPGFNITKYPSFALYRRKKDKWNKPYMLFNLTYGCFSLLIEVPRNNDDSSNIEFERLLFPPIRFFTSENGVWDLSSDMIEKEATHGITLNFGSKTDITDKYKEANS